MMTDRCCDQTTTWRDYVPVVGPGPRSVSTLKILERMDLPLGRRAVSEVCVTFSTDEEVN